MGRTKINQRTNRYKQILASAALRVSLIYLFISISWIAISGNLATSISSTIGLPLHTIELIKGIIYVFVTFLVLYILIQRSIRALVKREHKYQRLNRVYGVLSNINSAILRIRDKKALLQETCRIAVEDGLYIAAGIRLINEKTQQVELVASTGEAKEFVDNMGITLSPDDPGNQGPTGTALRKGKYIVINELRSTAREMPRRHQAEIYGIRSAAAFPLIVNGKTVGVITFFSSEINSFDSEEIRLLEDIAADTSLGLTHIQNTEQLYHMTFHDPVTDIPNRHLLEDRINQIIARYGRRSERLLALMVLNIENYHHIVENYGINMADNSLRAIATSLKDSVRRGDTIARLNMDFGILLVDVASVDDVNTVMHKLFMQLPQIVTHKDEDVVLRYRAGIAIYPRDGADSNEIIQRACVALSGATHQAESYKYYSKSQGEITRRTSTVERALHGALTNKEFKIYYQPIIDIVEKRTVGVEALIRWQNPKLGNVPPSDFIQLAEETGDIISIGYWVIEEVSNQLVKWLADGKNVYTAINISSVQLQQKGIAKRVLSIIENTGGSRIFQKIVIEITESSMMQKMEQVIPELNILNEAGITLYVDDFGTGYSSLSYLRRFPVDVLKIDREFITGLPHDADAVALVKGIIGMARGIDLRVVAEGVETEEQLSLLRSLGCDMAQGYLFSKPVLAGDIKLEYP